VARILVRQLVRSAVLVAQLQLLAVLVARPTPKALMPVALVLTFA
jgi:hypothetical protein